MNRLAKLELRLAAIERFHAPKPIDLTARIIIDGESQAEIARMEAQAKAEAYRRHLAERPGDATKAVDWLVIRRVMISPNEPEPTIET